MSEHCTEDDASRFEPIVKFFKPDDQRRAVLIEAPNFPPMFARVDVLRGGEVRLELTPIPVVNTQQS
jgi:hypothetical protein